MTRIHKLDKKIYEQIAAGEVINSPVSIVKECLENSIDAEANEITIKLIEGGIKSIIIQDDGLGIHQDDLILAVSKHATSKINKIEDLTNIQSLGFRGEALFSISSVAKLKIETIIGNDINGWMLEQTFDSEAKIQPCQVVKGTRITVTELFEQIPARKKFLLSARGEYKKIEQVLLAYSLSYFTKHFKLIHNNKIIHNLPACHNQQQIAKRISYLMGNDFVDNSYYLKQESINFSLTGWLGLPIVAINRSNKQFFFVNNRLITDNNLLRSVRISYKDVLYGKKFPCFILNLKINPELVDVNLSSNKTAIKFQSNLAIYDFIYSTLTKTVKKFKVDDNIINHKYHNEQNDFSDNFNNSAKKENDYKQSTTSFNNSLNKTREKIPVNFFNELKNFTNSTNKPLNANTYNNITLSEFNDYPLGYAITQLNEIYVIAKNSKGLILVDMHAAHERILYEKLKQQINYKNISQKLIVSININVSAEELSSFDYFKEEIKTVGFEVERSGLNHLIIRAIPEILIEKTKQINEVFKDILFELNKSVKQNILKDKTHKLLSLISCHKAFRKGQNLTIIQMNQLLREIENTDSSLQCNHGRPTVIKISVNDIDKLFMRGK